MKNIVRAFALVLAVSGAIAGVASSHAAKAEQVAVFSHQVISSAMPAAPCTPSNCGSIRGGK
jgi:hypothetical protein